MPKVFIAPISGLSSTVQNGSHINQVIASALILGSDNIPIPPEGQTEEAASFTVGPLIYYSDTLGTIKTKVQNEISILFPGLSLQFIWLDDRGIF